MAHPSAPAVCSLSARVRVRVHVQQTSKAASASRRGSMGSLCQFKGYNAIQSAQQHLTCSLQACQSLRTLE